MRVGTIFWLLLVAATGFLTFVVKYEVQGLDDAYAHTRNAIAAEESQIRALKAEWAYLNRPAALAAFNERFLSLKPIATQQLLADVSGLPMRPEAAPTPLAVAAAAPAIPPQTAPSPSRQPPAHPDALGQLIAQVAGR